jgi:preprotein translocase subunit SecA
VLKKQGINHSVLNAKHHEREAEIVAQAGRRGAVTIATNMAGRGTDIVLGGNPEHLAKQRAADETSGEYKDAYAYFKVHCAQEREDVLGAGGLFILGTERHESRRIDNQLRGRSGRQGDPGESRFFLSLEDDLMRRFGAGRITGLMDRLGMDDATPIEHKWVTRSIENAQKRVEGRNFDIRKNLLEYDEVLDKQRKAIYDLRNLILESNDVSETMLDLYEDTLLDVLNQFTHADTDSSTWNIEGLERQLHSVFALHIDLRAPEVQYNRAFLETYLWERIAEAYKGKEADLEYVAERYNERFAEAADFTPRTGADILREQERYHYLREIDKRWREHLTAMQALRDSVSLHGYAQKDPKNEYKREGFSMFEELLGTIRFNVSQYLFNIRVQREESVAQTEHRGPVRMSMGRGNLAAQRPGSSKPVTFRRAEDKVGRNDPCPCGSGKKYKKCCMLKDHAQAAM